MLYSLVEHYRDGKWGPVLVHSEYTSFPLAMVTVDTGEPSPRFLIRLAKNYGLPVSEFRLVALDKR